MKKFLIPLVITLLSLFLFSGCATLTRGDIIHRDSTGQVIQMYPNATIGSSYEADGRGLKLGGGLLFTDEKGQTRYISGGIITIDNVRSVADTPQTRKDILDEQRRNRGVRAPYTVEDKGILHKRSERYVVKEKENKE